MRMRAVIRKRLTALLLCVAAVLSLTTAAFAYDDSGGDGVQAISIRITPPQGTAVKSAPVEIRITDSTGEGFQTAKVKAGGGSWRDVTGELEQTENRYYCVVDITENCTVYVQVTGKDGRTYEKSEYIQCFDTASDHREPSGGGNTDDTADGGGSDTSGTEENTSQEQPSHSPGALTPDGQGTVVDNAASGDKEFFTISTPDENVFYLIIDRERDADNVYFLNTVTENDLLALADKSGDTSTKQPSESAVPGPADCVCKEKCEAGDVNTKCPVCVLSWKDCQGTAVSGGGQSEPEQPEKKSSSGTLIFVLLAALAAGGAGYYFKIYKPKHDLDGAEDLDDLTGGEDEPIVNEDADDDAYPAYPDDMFGDDEPDYPEDGGVTEEDDGI